MKKLIDDKGVGEKIIELAVDTCTFGCKQNEDKSSEIINSREAFFNHGISL
jgi:hypothetical protein